MARFPAGDARPGDLPGPRCNSRSDSVPRESFRKLREEKTKEEEEQEVEDDVDGDAPPRPDSQKAAPLVVRKEAADMNELTLTRLIVRITPAHAREVRDDEGGGGMGGWERQEKRVLIMKLLKLTKTRSHSFEILGFPLPGSALLPGWRDHSGGAVEVGHLGRRHRGLQGYRTDVTVRVLGMHRVMRMRRRVMMVMMMMKELGRGEGLARIMRPGVDRDRRALRRMQLAPHLVVQPAKDGAVPHAELVALRQGHRARRAREAAHVEDELARAHHQLGRQDRRLAARAPLHIAKHPANRTEKKSILYRNACRMY
ncbi:hypothetical protein X777_05017 [Ooceraea biroi]|uniref:Uncharacterized protein n=1 Tax=Ooceraea biroi TaxID=2015173 RepID=A0A026WFA1_OOCBI|nr:hypothetical protein X777_05017 [Ooceraea biroi]